MTRQPLYVMRDGYTLLELMLVLLLVGLTTLAVMRGLHAMVDRAEARNAVRASGALMNRARNEAMAQQTLVSVQIDTISGVLALVARGGSITTLPVGAMHGVALSTTRDSVTYDVRGLGFGTANLTLVARRGVAAETLVVSRLGRVRY
jgi:prepilin-type N-terminal cleavage/methylation domain-containing protein